MIPRTRLVVAILALAAALSALTASAATAVPQFTASSYPASDTGTGTMFWFLDAGILECHEHVETHAISGSTSTLTVTKHFSNCQAFGFLTATLDPEDCTYVFHVTEKTSAGVYRSHTDVTCPAGESLKIAAATCKAEVKAQNGLTTVKTTNLAGGSITVQTEVKGMAYTVTQDGFGCPFNGTGNKTGGEVTGDAVLSRVGGGSISVSGE